MAEALDVSELDDDELAALKEVSNKGYYHARPKSEPQSYAPEAIDGSEESTGTGKRSDFDAFQKKWDKCDGDEDALAAGLRERKEGSRTAASENAAGEEEEISEEEKKRLRQEKKVKKARLTKAMQENNDAEKAKARKSFICLIFMFGGGAMGIIGTIWSAAMGNGVVRLDVDNIAEVKDALFGGDPWLIYCVDNTTVKYPLPRVLEESAWDLHSNMGVKTGVLDCFKTLGSGKSIAQKFGYGNNPGMAFAIANGEKPRMVSLVGSRNYEDLERKIKPILSVEIVRIDQLQKWPKCSGRRACVIISHKTTEARDAALTVFKPLLEKQRGVKVVALDTSFWAVKLGDAVLKTRPQKPKTDKSADVLCLARDEGHVDKGPNETHSGTFLQVELDASSAADFMTACAKHQDLVSWGVAPKISAKTKKPKKTNPSPSPPKERTDSAKAPAKASEPEKDEPVENDEDEDEVEM